MFYSIINHRPKDDEESATLVKEDDVTALEKLKEILNPEDSGCPAQVSMFEVPEGYCMVSSYLLGKGSFSCGCWLTGSFMTSVLKYERKGPNENVVLNQRLES